MEGLLAQCRLYDYDVAAFSPLVQVCHYFTPYLKGELNIFELINFDLIDGLIIPPILLSENEEYKKLDKIMEFIGKKTTKPIILLDYPYGDYPVVTTDDRGAFAEITTHILDVHKCDPEKVYFLTGMKGYPDKMILAVGYNSHHKDYTEDFSGFEFKRAFDTKDMIPRLSEERDEPSVFYFMPVHFNEYSMGYAVLESKLSTNKKRVPSL